MVFRTIRGEEAGAEGACGISGAEKGVGTAAGETFVLLAMLGCVGSVTGEHETTRDITIVGMMKVLLNMSGSETVKCTWGKHRLCGCQLREEWVGAKVT